MDSYAGATRLVVEPVSVEKAARHAASLHDLFLLTPTEEEMDVLGIRDIPRFMADRRIKTIVVTRGENGLSLYHAGAREDWSPGRRVDARDTTGAGDLLLAALISELHKGVEMRAAVRNAMSVVEDRLAKETT